MFLTPDFFADLFKRLADLIIAHAALLHLAPERGKRGVGRGRDLDVTLDQVADVLVEVSPGPGGTVGEPLLLVRSTAVPLAESRAILPSRGVG